MPPTAIGTWNFCGQNPPQTAADLEEILAPAGITGGILPSQILAGATKKPGTL
jgi:hypothetical protein